MSLVACCLSSSRFGSVIYISRNQMYPMVRALHSVRSSFLFSDYVGSERKRTALSNQKDAKNYPPTDIWHGWWTSWQKRERWNIPSRTREIHHAWKRACTDLQYPIGVASGVIEIHAHFCFHVFTIRVSSCNTYTQQTQRIKRNKFLKNKRTKWIAVQSEGFRLANWSAMPAPHIKCIILPDTMTGDEGSQQTTKRWKIE